MIADNIVHFARVLRDAGMAIGPDRIIAAMAAIEYVGVDRREDVHAALSAVMIDRHEQQVLFDAAFDAYWRDPKLLEQMMYLLLPKITGRGTKAMAPRVNRLAEALAAASRFGRGGRKATTRRRSRSSSRPSSASPSASACSRPTSRA